MGHWWRAHDEAVDDPKLQRLNPVLFKAWFNLCCLASKNGGTLPSIGDIAYKLRVGEPKAAEIVTALVGAKLMDRRDDGKFAPHNWSERQFQSDSSTPRVKRFRERRRNVSSAVSETAPDTETDSEGGGGDARARDTHLSSEAIGLADELAVIAGHDPKFVPPSWCGAAMHVQKWRDAGWATEIIRETVRAIAGKKRDGPAATVTYFERGIARAIALHAAPLPTVQVVETPSEIVHAGREQAPNLQATAKRIASRLAQFEAGDDDRPVPAIARG